MIERTYTVAVDGFNTQANETLHIATLGLLSYSVDVEIVGGRGMGFPRYVEPVYYPPRRRTVKFIININNTEVVKEYLLSTNLIRIFVKFTEVKQIVTTITMNFIDNIKNIVSRVK